jgi:hypothetical protein
MRVGDVFSLAVAILGGLITAGLQPYSAAWWIGVIASSSIALGTGAHIAWINLPKSVQLIVGHGIWRPTGYFRPWIGIAILVAILYGGYVASHGHLNFGFLFAPKKVVQPAAPPAAPPPPKSWLDQTDIAYLRGLGRAPVNYSPQELVEMWANGHDTAAFVEEWIKVDYPLSSAPTLESNSYYVASFDLKPLNGFTYGALKAYFVKKSWEQKIFLLRPGNEVKAFCQYEGVSRTDVVKGYTYKDSVIADHCELYP